MEGAVAIVLAAGRGDRLGGETPKAFVSLAGRTLLERSVSSACADARIASVVVVASAGWEERARAIVGPFGVRTIVRGGATRQASVRAGLLAVPADAPAIVCHDAARALVRPELFRAVLEALDGWDGVVPVVPVADTVKRLRNGVVERTESRETLGLAQTPQAFLGPALRDAHDRAEREGIDVTDDAAALELAGYRVRAVEGDSGNFKITTAADLARAEAVLAGADG